MIKVLKYEVVGNIAEPFTIALPGDAKILSLQIFQEQPWLYVLGDLDNPPRHHTFVWHSTGIEIETSPERLHYLGTHFLGGGLFVFHLFEIKPLLAGKRVSIEFNGERLN